MFLVWGSKWEYKAKHNGLRVNKMCPECDRRATFYEVIPTKYFTLFWISIVSTEKKKPLLECPLCHARFYIQQSDYTNDIDVFKHYYEKSNNLLHTATVTENNIFRCDSCGQRLRIPIKEELLKITCPKCKISFLFQNGKIQSADVNSKHIPAKETENNIRKIIIPFLTRKNAIIFAVVVGILLLFVITVNLFNTTSSGNKNEQQKNQN